MQLSALNTASYGSPVPTMSYPITPSPAYSSPSSQAHGLVPSPTTQGAPQLYSVKSPSNLSYGFYPPAQNSPQYTPSGTVGGYEKTPNSNVRNPQLAQLQYGEVNHEFEQQQQQPGTTGTYYPPPPNHSTQ